MLQRTGTYHPHHDVGEASDPDGGSKERDEEPSLPAAFGAVGHGAEEKQRQRPHEQPQQLAAHSGWDPGRQQRRLQWLFFTELI